jgi:cytoskeletal protein CcmA (bactofilin family)
MTTRRRAVARVRGTGAAMRGGAGARARDGGRPRSGRGLARAAGCVFAAACAAFAAVPAPGVAAVAAQDTVRVGDVGPAGPQEAMPRAVAERAVEFYNGTRTIRLHGRTVLPAGRALDGDVAVLGGPVDVEGRVAGDLVVLNADLRLGASARVDGDVLVVGGRVQREEGAEVRGTVEAYADVVVVRRVGDRLVLVDVEVERRRVGFPFPIYSIGASDLLVTPGTYNRIEGLPIRIGPRIVTGGSNPLALEFLGIYRTSSGFRLNGDELGYLVRGRQYVGGRRAARLEATIHSLIEPIELRGLADVEAGLATFAMHRDYRDHYERTGWSAAFVWERERAPLALRLEYRDERHASVEPASPWTLVDNDEPFRPNAQVDGGELRSALVGVRYDTRNDPDRPWTGWWVDATWESGVGGSLSGRRPDFHRFVLDLRRYNRVSPSAAVDIRVAGGGRVGGGPLPAQRQHALGAEGSLPGYQRFEFDCGWRDEPLPLVGRVPGYGCERFALVQIQYRGAPRFTIAWGGEPEEPGPEPFRVRLEPALVVFYDAGAAWNGEGFWTHLTRSDHWFADVGIGVEFGGPGVYVAVPLREGAKGSNFFVRLVRRI